MIVLSIKSSLITYICGISQRIGLEELAHRITGCRIRIFFVLCFDSHRALHHFLTLLMTFNDCASLLLARLLHHCGLRWCLGMELLLRLRLAVLIKLSMGHGVLRWLRLLLKLGALDNTTLFLPLHDFESCVVSMLERVLIIFLRRLLIADDITRHSLRSDLR